MGGSGYFGALCPNCGYKGGKFIEPFIWGEKEKVECSRCKWNGEYKELLNSEGEFRNNKRTKLIDKILNA